MSGIVEREKLFQRILYSWCELREYATEYFILIGEYAKVFNRRLRMRQKSSSVQGEHGDFRVVLYKQSSLQSSARRKRLKTINVKREYAKSI
jgi:hypothetical protein